MHIFVKYDSRINPVQFNLLIKVLAETFDRRVVEQRGRLELCVQTLAQRRHQVNSGNRVETGAHERRIVRDDCTKLLFDRFLDHTGHINF